MRPMILLVMGLLFSAVSPAWGQMRFVADPATKGASLAVVVPGEVSLWHTQQLLPTNLQAGAAEQLDNLLVQLKQVLGRQGSSLKNLVKVNFCAANQEAVAAIDRALSQQLPGASRPAVSLVVTPLPEPRALVSLDAVAALPGENVAPAVKINKDGALLPPGARVWISGQAEKGDLAEATRQTMESLRRSLQFMQLDDQAIVQLKAFVRPMSEVATAHKEIVRFFGKQPVPPVVYVEWKNSLPIEIELIAWGGPKKPGEAVAYLTPTGMKASPVYSRIARVNHGPLIYLGGLHPAKVGQPAEEIVEVFDHLGQVLTEAGSDLRHLVKATYYVLDGDTTKKMGELRPRYYDPQRPPAASMAMVAGTGRTGRHLTLDMIAVPK